MPSGGDGEVSPMCKSTFFFILLTLIRGGTPLAMFYGVYFLKSPVLVVGFKCAVSFCIFLIQGIFLLRKAAVRSLILANLKTKSTYWKLAVFSLLQNVLPYWLMVYGIQYIPITMNSVTIAMTPWWVLLFQRMCNNKQGARIAFIVRVGISLGSLGSLMMFIPIFVETAGCNNRNVTNKIFTSENYLPSKQNVNTVEELTEYICHPLGKVVAGAISILLSPVLLIVISFLWRTVRGDIHDIIRNIGQNMFGAVITGLVWTLFNVSKISKSFNWNTKHWWISSVVYLGFFTGWAGSVIVVHLHTRLGSRSINQALTGVPIITFIIDCYFVRDMLIKYSYVLIIELSGLLLVTTGVFLSNLSCKPIISRKNIYCAGADDVTEKLLGSTSNGKSNEDLRNENLRGQMEQYDSDRDYSRSCVVSRNSTQESSDGYESNEITPAPLKIVKYPLMSEVFY